MNKKATKQNSWQNKSIKELGQIITGKTPSQKNPEDWGSKIFFVTPTDYKSYKKFACSSERKLSQLGLNRLKNKIIPSNSIMVTCIGSDMGKVAINKNPVITNQQINSIVPNLKKINPDFLYYRLADMYDLLRVYGTAGTAVPIVNKRDFENINIYLPSLPEQKAIAEVLSSLDDKIDLLNRQNKILEHMAQIVFKKWFTHAGVEYIRKTSEEIKLSDLTNHKKVSIKPSNNPETYYYHYSIPSFDNSKNPIKELGKDIMSNKYKVFGGSILISKLNPRFPRIWPIFKEVDDNAVCSTEFQVVHPKDDKTFGFIYCFLKSKMVTNKLISIASGTSGSHQRVRPEDIFNLPLINPSNKVLERFSSITDDYWARIFNNKTQINTLVDIRDTLLPKLMNGTVKVKL